MNSKLMNLVTSVTTDSVSVLEYVQSAEVETALNRHVVENTVGTDPMNLLRGAVMHAEEPALREFLARVLDEPESRQVLTQLISNERNATHPVRAVQLVRRAAQQVQHWCAVGRQERDVLYVATFIKSLQALLEQWVVGASSAQDVTFTIVRIALHRLDDSAPRHARLLRLSLGWGNEDEIDSQYVPRLRQSVLRAVRSVQDQLTDQTHGAAWGLTH